MKAASTAARTAAHSDRDEARDRPAAQLALLVPGANSGGFGGVATRGGGVSIGGTRPEQNAFQLDGVTNSDRWDSNIVVRPNVDSIQEFKIEVGNHAPE